MWAHLHQPRCPSVGASHRAPSSDLSYMSCTQQMWPGRSSLCGWYTAPRQLSGFGCGSIIAIGPPFHWGSSSVDGVKQASTESGQNPVHLVRYEATTREAELWSTVFGVANSSVRHTRPEPRGHPGQWAADGDHISQLCCSCFFQLRHLRIGAATARVARVRTLPTFENPIWDPANYCVAKY